MKRRGQRKEGTRCGKKSNAEPGNGKAGKCLPASVAGHVATVKRSPEKNEIASLQTLHITSSFDSLSQSLQLLWRWVYCTTTSISKVVVVVVIVMVVLV